MTIAPSSSRDAFRVPDMPFLGLARGPALVNVVSGSFGAGHDAAAREIEDRLRAAGHHVRRWDVVDLIPGGLGRLVRWAYLTQITLSPQSWGILLARLVPGSRYHRLVSRLLGLPGRALLGIDAAGADLFISTHPFASQALGRLRASGELATPVATYLTDMSVHPLWVHESVDLHLALHEVAAAQARALGGKAVVVEPLTPRRRKARLVDRASLRTTLGIGQQEPVALVVGGSLGIGELEETAREIADTGLARVVVLCGRNDALRARLVGRPGVLSLGWRDDLHELLEAVDVVVQNAGGFMSLEALAAGVPVVSHRCLPGHGTTNAAALEQAGLAPWSRNGAELALMLTAALAGEQSPVVSSAPQLMDVLCGPVLAVSA